MKNMPLGVCFACLAGEGQERTQKTCPWRHVLHVWQVRDKGGTWLGNGGWIEHVQWPYTMSKVSTVAEKKEE